jgi:caffeoyl-CoA O-methyltransferase
MTAEAMPVALLDYVRDLFAPEEEALKAISRSAVEAGMPADWEISRDVGRLFQVICGMIGARRVLEFGTFAGHSAYWFARALPPEGRVVSVELNPEWAAVARRNLDRAGVGARVDIRLGACYDLLPALEAEVQTTGQPYDVFFLDTDKTRYPIFLEWAARLLRPGGVLLADNVLRSGSWGGQSLLDPTADEPRILAVREFNQQLSRHPHFTATILPVRAGVALGVYQPVKESCS